MIEAEPKGIFEVREPTSEELEDPKTRLSLEFTGLLLEAHPLLEPDKFIPSPQFLGRLDETVTEITQLIPDINKESLRKMVLKNPQFIPGWIYGGTMSEFHMLALSWDSRMWSGNRVIAEKEYGMGETERDFLEIAAHFPPPIGFLDRFI